MYSGHADRRELLAWIEARLPIRRGVFVTHGEEDALLSLKSGIVGLGLAPTDVVIPRLDQEFVLHPAAHPRAVLEQRGGRMAGDATAVLREGRDWHNDYATFALDLQDRLRGIADDRARRTLLRRLKEVLRTDA